MSFFSKKSGEFILILDVQSSIVRGTVVHQIKDQLPLVLCTHNIQIPYKADTDSNYLVKEALKAIKEAIASTSKYILERSAAAKANKPTKEIPNKISAVHYVLSSPWIVSQAKTLHLSFKEDAHITKKYIMDVIREERSKLSNKNDSARIVEEKVFDVRLNGYSVSSWESKFTRELQISFVVSIVGGKMIDRLIVACDHIVRKSAMQFHSSLFLQHLGVEKIVLNSSSYALVHIHGELTDVAIVKDRSCVFFGSYPMGIQSVTRKIASQTGTDDQAAESLLTMSIKGHLDSAHAEKDLVAVEDARNEWINQFRNLINSNSGSGVSNELPHHVIVSAHSHEDFFMRSLIATYPANNLENLAIESMSPHVIFDPQAEQLRLTGAYVIAISSL